MNDWKTLKECCGVPNKGGSGKPYQDLLVKKIRARRTSLITEHIKELNGGAHPPKDEYEAKFQQFPSPDKTLWYIEWDGKRVFEWKAATQCYVTGTKPRQMILAIQYRTITPETTPTP